MASKQQASDLARALARAQASGLTVIGQGHMQATNQRFFLVPSASEPGARTHIVTSDERHLHCDCAGSLYGQSICQHRAITHQFLCDERARKEASNEEVQRALAESEAEQALHEAARVLEATLNAQAPKARGQRLGPRLRNDQRAFSVFK